MIKLHVKFNLKTKEWKIKKVSAKKLAPHLYIHFISDKKFTYFSELKFGFILNIDKAAIQSKFWPLSPTVHYIGSDAISLVNTSLKCEKNTEYNIFFWVNNENIRYDHTISFKT
jgi:hypothetical protein